MVANGRVSRLAWLIVPVLLCAVSCAPPAEKKVWDIVWPLPPEQPRIKFVDTLKSNADVEGPAGFSQTLFGEDVAQILYKPYGVAADKEGRVYVTDVGKIFIFDKKNQKLSYLGSEPGSGRVRQPVGIAVSGDGKVYVTDISYDRVFVYDRKGSYVSAIGQKGDFESPSGLAFDDKRGRLYVVDSRRHNVRAFAPDGTRILTIGERGDKPGEFNIPTNIALDTSGNLYVVDTGNFRVQVFDPEGKLIRTFGQLGNRPGDFTRAKGIAVDSENHIYVVDAAFQTVQIFDNEGKLLLFFGEPGVDPGQFSLPAGIFIDSDDRIYVVDQMNTRVQIFDYLGEKWKARQAAPATVPAAEKAQKK